MFREFISLIYREFISLMFRELSCGKSVKNLAVSGKALAKVKAKVICQFTIGISDKPA